MADPGKKLVGVLLDRLYATLVNGPLMSCRPHSSRQRIDLFQLSKLRGLEPSGVMAALLGEARSAKLLGPTESAENGGNGNGAKSNGDELRGLLAKLRTITEDARTYEEDTGTQALFLGFPLLNLPPESSIGNARAKKRILAPLAFIPLRITIKATRPAAVMLEAIGEGADLVVPNAALLAWVERMTGKDLGELFADGEGKDPWREINELVQAVTRALELPTPAAFTPGGELAPTPRSDAEDSKQTNILASAVIGLFPAANQGLLTDLEALHDGEPAVGPIESFLKAGTDLGVHREADPGHAQETTTSLAGSERCVSQVDPCQARAVHLARKVKGLVIHGPPGTGKSQTITNIIGDHLANGERVLFVCDKRTALDVVAYRLNHIGLGSLCAVVHDARRDQRDLYRGVREQLDTLAETPGRHASVAELGQIDAEISRIHAELTQFEQALSERPGGVEPSFHELVGAGFALRSPLELATGPELPGVPLNQLLPLESAVKEAMERGAAESYPHNPWKDALQGDLAGFLSRPFPEWEGRLKRVLDAARGVDTTRSEAAVPFAEQGDAAAEGAARAELGGRAEAALKLTTPARLAQWLNTDRAAIGGAAAEVEAVSPQVELISAPADRELALATAQGLAITELTPWIGKLSSYLQIARRWYAFFLFGRRRAAREVIERFGLSLGEETATRVSKFLSRLRARRLLEGVTAQLLGTSTEASSDSALTNTVAEHAAIFRVVRTLDESPALRESASRLRAILADTDKQSGAAQALAGDLARGQAIAALEQALRDAGLLAEPAQRALVAAARRGEPTAPVAQAWVGTLASVEGLLRINALLEGTGPVVATLVRELLEQGAAPENAWTVVRAAAIKAEIGRRLQTNRALLATDGDRVQSAHQRYRDLNGRRRELVRDLAHHVWVSRQRERLLASTGSRLNTAGAEIRRRLVTRGERAMRVRQMIGAGASIEGGDPLFDLRPVWMASPDVVAQLFPREAVFDVVIFDEASQCRLEEGLPVLLRAKRVVIAGDPQQLPPTRFFESAVAQSQEQESETEQELFETQQAEVEDLLGAALNLSVEQAYLDVHYRSSNSDLIHFSNQNFYESRLQAIPAHPSAKAALPPLRLIPVGGVYDKRANPREALEVVKVVKHLLADEQPPSIGIACFNLAQRDEIVEALDRAGAEDPTFGARLAEARVRKGAASFEGLFVRNLENVQGDERDHMIISTTYGPDPNGRFYRRFGPLGQAGGGRRLNVLVTRARQMVHLVTSIPRAVYGSAAPLPAGTNPNGAWLLFDYLRYAENLEHVYAEAQKRAHDSKGLQEAVCRVLDTKYPSELAAALGEHLRDGHGVSSWVHWGNDGFAVDTALVHPERPDDVTIGLLCDGSRFAKAADRVQWDIFRAEVLESQKWRLLRLWSPQLFRNPAAVMARVKKAVDEWLAEEAAKKGAAVKERQMDARLLN